MRVDFESRGNDEVSCSPILQKCLLYSKLASVILECWRTRYAIMSSDLTCSFARNLLMFFVIDGLRHSSLIKGLLCGCRPLPTRYRDACCHRGSSGFYVNNDREVPADSEYFPNNMGILCQIDFVHLNHQRSPIYT